MAKCPDKGIRCRKPGECDGVVNAPWKFFYAQCNLTNPACANKSGAWVAASAVCHQRLDSCLYNRGEFNSAFSDAFNICKKFKPS